MRNFPRDPWPAESSAEAASVDTDPPDRWAALRKDVATVRVVHDVRDLPHNGPLVEPDGRIVIGSYLTDDGRLEPAAWRNPRTGRVTFARKAERRRARARGQHALPRARSRERRPGCRTRRARRTRRTSRAGPDDSDPPGSPPRVRVWRAWPARRWCNAS
jgi:hypothetical protein